MRSSTRAIAPERPLGEAGALEKLLQGSAIAELLEAMRRRKPRVHCVTNSVAQAFTANLLLAAGAIPSMTVAPEEIAHFVPRAGALLINLGTLDGERKAALPLALDAAAAAGIKVVLDPVFADASPPRLALARRLLAGKPAILRLNAAEFAALAGHVPRPEAVRDFAAESGATIALTGATDIVSDGTSTVGIRNGHELMAQVTAMGCAAGALMAALLASGCDPLEAAVAGLSAMGVAGEIAAETARGPGSFAVAILDALANLDGAALEQRLHIDRMSFK